MSALAPVAKAVAGAVVSGVSATLAGLGASMADGDVTRPEVIAAVGLGLAAAAAGFGGVYVAPKNTEA